MQQPFGLALSGGGARGIAHIGVLQALGEMGYRPSALSGTSAGAIVAACYSSGLKPADILKLLKESKLFSWQDIAWNRESLFKGAQMEALLRKALPNPVFEALEIPVSVHATDFSSGRAVAFSSGDLIKPLMASAAIPAVFHGVDIEGITYYDGGLLNNLPADSLLQHTSCIIGVHVNKLSTLETKPSFRVILERSFHMMIASSVAQQENLCALVIEPDLHEYGMFDMEQAQQICERGYTHTRSMQEAIKKVLGNPAP